MKKAALIGLGFGATFYGGMLAGRWVFASTLTRMIPGIAEDLIKGLEPDELETASKIVNKFIVKVREGRNAN